MPQLFISYSHNDRKPAERLAEGLRRIYGHDAVWYDDRLFAGDAWWSAILEQIAAADSLIFLVSEHSIDSEYCQKELAEARRLHKPIIPILIRNFPPEKLPPELARLQHIAGNGSDNFARLIEAINQQSGAVRFGPPKRPLTPEPTPAPNIHQHIGVMKGGTAIGHQNIQRQVNVTNNRKFVVAGSAFAVLVLFIIILVLLLRPSQQKPSFAYEFLVDTSAQMLDELNGVPRHQIVEQAIEQTSFAIETTLGESFSRVWQGLRTAGGGDCNQTELAVEGHGVSAEAFTAPLKSRLPSGENAYPSGIQGTFIDMQQPAPTASDVRIVFIVLGSLDKNCDSGFSLPTAMGFYKTLRVSTTLCIFTLLDEAQQAEFENFRIDLEQQGFSCVYNLQDATELPRIAINEIRKEVQRITSQEVTLIPNSDPINPIGAKPSVIPATQGSASITPEPSSLPPLPTATQQMTETPSTAIPTQTTLTATQQPTDAPPATNTPPTLSVPVVNTSTVNPVVTAESPTVIVTEATANLRSGPGTNYAIVGTARRGDTFPVLAKAENTSGTWYLIQRTGNLSSSTAWIFGELVELRPPEAVIRPAATIPASPIPVQPTVAIQVTTQTNTTAQICSPGQWDGTCGAHDCPADSIAQCNTEGTGWTCVWDPGTCNSGAVPPVNTCPTSGSC